MYGAVFPHAEDGSLDAGHFLLPLKVVFGHRPKGPPPHAPVSMHRGFLFSYPSGARRAKSP